MQSGPTPKILCNRSASQKQLAPADQVAPLLLPQAALNISQLLPPSPAVSVRKDVSFPPNSVFARINANNATLTTGSATHNIR